MFVHLLDTFHTPFPFDSTSITRVWLDIQGTGPTNGLEEEAMYSCFPGCSTSEEEDGSSLIKNGSDVQQAHVNKMLNHAVLVHECSDVVFTRVHGIICVRYKFKCINNI